MLNCGCYILIFLLFTGNAFSQSTPENALRILDEKYPQEKIHLFINKEEFVAGETVWFKAYLFSGYVKSFISSTLYAELYDDEGNLVDRAVIPMWNAVGHGSFLLKEYLPEGVFHIRAYTKWMLNFDPAFEYNHHIAVYNPSSSKRLTRKPVSWKAASYPESGTLLAGKENKVVVRLKPVGSLPEQWTGSLIDMSNGNKALLQFNSLTPDVASFLFTPEPDHVYEVHIKDAAGNFSSIALSPVTSGVLLQAEQSGSEVYVDMIFQGLPEGGLNYKLVAHMQQQLVLSSVIRKKQDLVKTSIPVGKLMTGILQLTLFDPAGRPVAERLLFVHQQPASSPPIAGWKDIDSMGRQKWWLDTDSADYFNYAVAITDTNINRRRNIYTDLWFGDLAGMPQNPVLYFTGRKEDVLSVDALLITETWSRFQWKEALAGQLPAIKDSAEKYFSYRGTVSRYRKAVPNEKVNLMFRFADSSLQFAEVKTNEFGEFFLQDFVFFDSVKLFYHPGKGRKANNDAEISLERINGGYSPLRRRFPAAAYHLADRNATDASISPWVIAVRKQQEALKDADNRYKELAAVEVSAERKTAKQKLNEQLASPLFQTQNETVFDIMNDEPSIQSHRTIFDWLDGRVPGLSFRVASDNDADLIDPITGIVDPGLVGQRIPMMRDQQPSLFIDEMPTDLIGFMSLPTSEIALVKVIKGYFLAANSGGAGGGAIVVYTRKAGLANLNARPPMPSATIYGYSSVKPFPLVDGKPKLSEGDLSFWKPFLLPDANGRTNIEFYLPETVRPYRIAVTGFTADSTPVFIELTSGKR